MDQAQTLRQIEYLLATNLMASDEFGRVTIGEESSMLGDRPEALIVDGGFEGHDQWRVLGWMFFSIRIMTVSRRGPRGREGVIADRGQKVMQRKVLDQLELLQDVDGIIYLEHPNAFGPVVKGHRGRGEVFTSEISCEAFVGNDANDYPPAIAFAAATGSASGEIDLTFTNAPARWDRIGVHIRHATGSAPATVNDGTQSFVGTASPQTISGLLAATEYFFSCFATYDADWNGAPGSTPTTADTFSTALNASATSGA